jgi:hypothetical protein
VQLGVRPDLEVAEMHEMHEMRMRMIRDMLDPGTKVIRHDMVVSRCRMQGHVQDIA